MFNCFGGTLMKKIAFAFAAAGLLSLAACGPKNDASANLENAADNLDAAADNLSGNSADLVENAADNVHAMADNAADANASGGTSDPATAANVAVGNAL